jgi:anti-sigma regulatory factor (Ser/Thr protein kinase)
LEAGRLTLEKVPFDFCELIEGAFSLLYPQAERKQLVYGITYSHLLPRRFLGDPFRMRQVALNLLSNAIKFTQSGSVFLHAEQGERRGGAVWMKLSVEDTGIGIDEAKLRMIFDEFQQADPSTTRKYGGTGLGLSLSRRIVDLMGGEISAESEVNRGSRFVAQIPLFPLSTTASDSPNTPSNPLEGIRLLVQDRHSPQSKALRRLLETLPGVEIQLFQTEEEAVNRLNAHVQSVHPVDAIISSHRSTSFSPEVAQAMLRSGGMTAPIHILLNEQSGYVATRTASSNNTLTIQAPILPSRVFAVLNQLRRLPVGPLFESAGLTALDVYRDAAALPSAKQRPTLVAHANPVELRLLEAMLQKLGVSFESVRAEDDLLPMLRDRRFKALVVHGQLLKSGVPDALVSADREMEQDLRVMVVGEVDDAVARCLAESYTAFAHYENAPRVSQLRDFLTA